MQKKDDEALRLLGEVVKSQGERTDLDNNVNEVSRPSGNSKSYTLDRLAREDPAQWHDFLRDGTASIPYKSGFRANRTDKL